MPHPNPNPNPNPNPKPILGFDTKSHGIGMAMKRAYNTLKMCDAMVNDAKFGVKPKVDDITMNLAHAFRDAFTGGTTRLNL